MWEIKKVVWLWWAICRTSKKVVGWVLGDRDTPAAKVLGAQLVQSASILKATDKSPCYNAIFAHLPHIRSKTQTCTTESMNNQLRC